MVSSGAGGGESASVTSSSSQIVLNADLVRDAFNRNLLFIVYIDQACEQFNSINLVVLNKWRLLAAMKQNSQQQLLDNNNIKIGHTIKGIFHLMTIDNNFSTNCLNHGFGPNLDISERFFICTSR